MQAITVAIGKTGVSFFSQHYLAATLSQLLAQITPPNRTVSVPDFQYSSGQDWWEYSNIAIVLSNGQLFNFNAGFQNVSQGISQDGKNIPIFTLNFSANQFSPHYNWQENFHYKHHYVEMDGKIPVWKVAEGDASNPYTFQPLMNLNAAIVIQFLFDSPANNWEATVYGTSANGAVTQDNIPTSSILNGQDNSCTGSHVDQATVQAIDAINFATPINAAISGIIKTIPGSGNLGNGIVYDFSLGDSGLLFPNNDGIQMGVKGGASYNGTAFSGPTPPSLPLPIPPSDSDTVHHLNMYVSNYEVDALNWAYYKAGKLNLLITPQDLPDPDLLLVSSYSTYESSLAPYSAFVMNAQLTQNIAPVTSFQTAYVYSKSVMALLQQQLPADIYTLIGRLPSNAYLSQTSLETFLTQATVPNQYFTTIENAGKISAMVLTQDISYTLIIQNNDNPQPNIKFSVKRTDVLINLSLGLSSNNAQTLQFGFANAVNSVIYESSTVPGFSGGIIFVETWNLAAEGYYADNLAKLGNTGVPLPIMQDFQFDFSNAELSIQNGYVSILASVLYKNSSNNNNFSTVR